MGSTKGSIAARWLFNLQFLSFAALASFAQPTLAAATAFDGLSCSDDIASALRGRAMPDARVAQWEDRYRSLTLKALGADLPERGVTLIGWSICGDTYMLLERNDKVADVLKVLGAEAPSSRLCKRSGPLKPESYLVLGSKSAPSKAVRAWSVDYETAHFQEIATDGLACEPPDA